MLLFVLLSFFLSFLYDFVRPYCGRLLYTRILVVSWLLAVYHERREERCICICMHDYDFLPRKKKM